MISVADNQVTICINNAKLVQTFHPETNQPFTCKEDIYNWLIESSWFERCKQAFITLIKQQARIQLEKEVPFFKQVNASLGIYSEAETNQIISAIERIRNQVNKKEQAILNAQSVEEFLNLLHSDMKLDPSSPH